MNPAATSRKPAYLCAFVLLLCALASFPVAEIGIIDDWSYVKSAQVLARTGHIAYFGWDTPILGWQLFVGALFVKLFGSSYTAIRASTLLVAMAAAFLAQRTFVRAGINSRAATIGTLALILSPLFLPLAVSFMTDIGGLFCVLLCLYACLRALQARTDRAVLAWLAFAALSNALGGNVRQIAWLGVLVMFPSTVWILRRRPHVLIVGAMLYAVSVIIVYGSLRWFHHQPHTELEPLFPKFPGPQQSIDLAAGMTSLFFIFALFLLPILIAFVSAISSRYRRIAAIVAFAGIPLLAIASVLAFHLSLGSVPLPPLHDGNYVTPYGIPATFAIKGAPPIALSTGFRVFITTVILFSLLCFFISLFSARPIAHRAQAPPEIAQPVSLNSLLILLVPFALAYLALLLPRSARGELYDRYLLLLLPVALVLLLRLYQDHAQPNLPLACNVLVLLFAAYATASTHDAFSMYRAKAAAVSELLAANIPDTSIDAGFEHNAMAQIQRVGYITGPHLHPPTHDNAARTTAFPGGCQPQLDWLTPAIIPGYALSFNPRACGGLSRFAPVTFHEWLTAQTVSIYIVNTEKPASVRP